MTFLGGMGLLSLAARFPQIAVLADVFRPSVEDAALPYLWRVMVLSLSSL
jgi:hypothetical protein